MIVHLALEFGKLWPKIDIFFNQKFLKILM